MKISEAIEKLKKIQKEHGDLVLNSGDVHATRWEAHLIDDITAESPFGEPEVTVWHSYGRYCGECGRGCD
jgi:hypothetical protein